MNDSRLAGPIFYPFSGLQGVFTSQKSNVKRLITPKVYRSPENRKFSPLFTASRKKLPKNVQFQQQAKPERDRDT